MELTIGKIHELQQCTRQRGTFTCLALDHRQNLRIALNPENPSAVTDSDLTDYKLDVATALVGEATPKLFDPEYSATQAVARGGIPGMLVWSLPWMLRVMLEIQYHAKAVYCWAGV